MIARLRGTVAARSLAGVVLDVGGVGYEVAVTPRGLSELPSIGEEAVLHVHLHVRDDQLALFGFPSDEERDLFRVLVGVTGVGPKVALAILGTMTVDEIHVAVVGEDADALTVVPGIGKRSAQKLILELRPRLDVAEPDLPGASASSEVRLALENLGYQAEEIRTALAGLPGDVSVEELLKLSLRELGRQGQRP